MRPAVKSSITVCMCQPTFRILAKQGAARAGHLQAAHGELETPALLLYTRRGSPLYLTPDILTQLGSESRNIFVDATQFTENPSPETIDKVVEKGRGFCAFQDRFMAVTGRDSSVYNYSRWMKSTKKTVRVEAYSGSKDLSPQQFFNIAQMFEPDLLVPISHEVPAASEPFVHQISVDRSLKWLDTILSMAANHKSSTGVLAPILGGTSTRLREQSAQQCAKREGVFGYALCGFATGESCAERAESIQAAVRALPEEAPRLLQGALTPDSLLEAVSLGVDILDATYATQVTAAGYALDMSGSSDPSTAATGHDDLKLNLLDTALREDQGPLVSGCTCFTCLNHSRAYVHHLLAVHEMTAQVLLELHNLHQLLGWFKQVRIAVREGKLVNLQSAFLARRHSFMTAAVL